MLKKQENKNEKKQKTTLGLWEQYSDFVRSLHLEFPYKELSTKQKIFNYLNKILIVIFGAFFTTFAFYFFIDANSLYNGGLNGLLQLVAQLWIGKRGISWGWFRWIYHGLSLLINGTLILFLWRFCSSKIEIISTSIFYILSQFFWSFVFDKFSFFFSGFAPSVLVSSNSFFLILPYYMVVVLIAAVIHSIGYGLIIKAQTTPGGYDLLATHLSIKKSSFSIAFFGKIFNILVVFSIIIINTFVIENDSVLKRNFLQRGWNNVQTKESFEVSFQRLKSDIEKIKKEQELAHKGRNKKKEVCLSYQTILLEVNKNKENEILIDYLKKRTGIKEKILVFFPQEIDYYTANLEEKEKMLEKEIVNVTEFNNLKNKRFWKPWIDKRTLELKKKEVLLKQEKNKNQFISFLTKISNNEKLWATFVYIFLSSYLLNLLFPSQRDTAITIYCNTEEDLQHGLELLKEFSPVYTRDFYNYRYKEEGKEKQVFMIKCKLSQWNYYLRLPYIKQLGTIHEN